MRILLQRLSSVGVREVENFVTRFCFGNSDETRWVTVSLCSLLSSLMYKIFQRHGITHNTQVKSNSYVQLFLEVYCYQRIATHIYTRNIACSNKIFTFFKLLEFDQFQKKNFVAYLVSSTFKGQHQCNSIEFWTFFWVEGKVVRKNAFRMYLAMHLSLQGNFVIDKYLKMAALEPFFCSVFFLRHALELPQI